MKILSTVLTAAFIAGGCTVAMAQGGTSGTGAAGPDDTARPGMSQGADQNPSAPGTNPAAGNPDGARGPTQPGMTTAPVAGRPNTGAPTSQPNAQSPVNPGSKTDAGSGGGDGK
jgi:hypothetical protein